jgi:hypothetical protein
MSETSSELLTAVLAASAKFFRPDLYPDLLEHAQALINRAIGAGACDIGIVQCLMIVVCWKAPTDRSAFIKVGMAIRLGYQHGWYLPSTRVLPDNEREARLLLVSTPCESRFLTSRQNQERTWLCE